MMLFFSRFKKKPFIDEFEFYVTYALGVLPYSVNFGRVPINRFKKKIWICDLKVQRNNVDMCQKNTWFMILFMI